MSVFTVSLCSSSLSELRQLCPVQPPPCSSSTTQHLQTLWMAALCSLSPHHFIFSTNVWVNENHCLELNLQQKQKQDRYMSSRLIRQPAPQTLLNWKYNRRTDQTDTELAVYQADLFLILAALCRSQRSVDSWELNWVIGMFLYWWETSAFQSYYMYKYTNGNFYSYIVILWIAIQTQC